MDPDHLKTEGEFVSTFLLDTSLPVSDEHACPYLPAQKARSEGFAVAGEMDEGIYRALMDRGFRRSGQVFYRPICPKCRKCQAIRVPVSEFRPSRSMRRVIRKNADVRVVIGDGLPSFEKHVLFARYLDDQHDGTMSSDREAFEDFLYDSPIDALELCYYVGKRLVGVSLLDVVPDALSSVYMFFDPREARRSLGTFSILWEIEHCRSQGVPYYYLGYWVPGSRTMAYKARFQPAEILDASGRWTPMSNSEREE